MIRDLPPYPAYKDSGVPWLGQVPAHWEVMPVKRALRPQSCGTAAIKNTAAATPLDGYAPAFSASGQDVWLPRASHCGSALVLSAVGARCGKTFRADGEWGVVANTHILWPRTGQNRDFWWYVTNNEAWWDKAGAAQPFVRVSATLERSWVIPPLPEQTAIVRFLDYVERRIRRFIRAKQKLIKLLEEYRQALIHQAVTGKIDVRTGKPYPAYKDSGVPWLGHVPQHWEVVKLKFISKRMQNGSTPPTDVGEYYADQGIPWYGPSSLLEEILIGLPVRFVTERAILDNKVRVIQPPALVISVIGNVGKSALMLEQGATNQQLTCCELDQKICNPVFVVNQFRMAEHYLVASASSTTIAILDSEVLRNMPLAIPPLPEQTAIVEYLDAQTAKLDAAIAAARREIELLREYRERLIADVVTGKVDVRQVAAQLPEEPAEEEAGTEEEEPVADELATVDSQEESNGEE